MLVILLFSAFALLFYWFLLNKSCGRSAFLFAALACGVLTVAFTEILSLFQALNWVTLSLAWLAVNGIVGFQLWRLKPTLILPKIPVFPPGVSIALIGITLIVGLIGIIAFVAPPNTWDSLNYHMVRVVHWMQNQSVAHYPTHFEPQLYQNPFMEFMVLNLQVLSGSDRFANGVQWFACIGSLIGVSLVAYQLGANLLGQVFASAFTVAIPMGILQASSVKNDYLLGFWLVCLSYSILRLAQRNYESITYGAIASSLALAVLTKGTAYVYAFPFVIWLGFVAIKRLGFQAGKLSLIVVGLGGLLNAGHFLRNYQLYRSFLGPLKESSAAEGASYSNDLLGLPTMLSNMTRNIGSNLGTPIGLFNGIVYGIIKRIHGLIGLSIDDPRTTFAGKYYVPGGLSTIGINGNEDNASNTIACVLILGAIAAYFLVKHLRKNPYLNSYLITLISSFLLFCLMFKWQTWMTRLHLPLLILFAPFVGVIYSRIAHQKVIQTLTILLLLTALPWVSLNRNRPLIGDNNLFGSDRTALYYIRRPHLETPYQQAIQRIQAQNCNQIGLEMAGDPWEYPIWATWYQSNRQTPIMKHLNVKNASAAISEPSFNPCAIFYFDGDETGKTLPDRLETNTGVMRRQFQNGPIGVFLP